eukprot:4760920-Pleurochrysis_carterae.AAC.1
MSPPGAAGSANGVRPENSRKSPHHSRTVLRRLWSATSRTRAWNARRRPATPSACCSVGWPPSHSSVLIAPSTPVSCNCSARRATLSAAQARSSPPPVAGPFPPLPPARAPPSAPSLCLRTRPPRSPQTTAHRFRPCGRGACRVRCVVLSPPPRHPRGSPRGRARPDRLLRLSRRA